MEFKTLQCTSEYTHVQHIHGHMMYQDARGSVSSVKSRIQCLMHAISLNASTSLLLHTCSTDKAARYAKNILGTFDATDHTKLIRFVVAERDQLDNGLY